MAKPKIKKKEIVIPQLNPKQMEFFKAKTRYIAYGGARGGGKSFAMRNLFVVLALQYPELKLLLLRRTFPELRENHIMPLQAMLDGIARYNNDEKAFTFPNRSRLKLGYCDNDSDVLQYQGQEYEVIGFEESTLFTEFQMQQILLCNRSTRTDFKPRAYFTCNPGGPSHQYIKRLFIDKDYNEEEDPEEYTFIQAKVYDNHAIMENNPEYVKMLKALPEEQRRAFLDGDWDVFAGQYFPEFRRTIHVIKPFELPDYWKRFRSLDYGLDMTACYWWAVDLQGKCYIYRELHQPGLNLSQAARKIVDMTPNDEDIIYTVASPDLWNRRQETGESGMEIMSRAGLTGLRKANNARVQGWRVLREYLAPYEDEQGIRSARLQIFDTCPNLIRCLPLLQHDKHDPEDAADTPHEVTHAPESIRYGVLSRPPLSSMPVIQLPIDLPPDLKADLEADPEAMRHWLSQHPEYK